MLSCWLLWEKRGGDRVYFRLAIHIRDYHPDGLTGGAHWPHGGNGDALTHTHPPPFRHGSWLFLSLYCFVLDGQSCPRWYSRAWLELAHGELNPQYLEIRQVISLVLLTGLPKYELFFVVESEGRERFFCIHLLAFWVNKIVWHGMSVVNVVYKMEEKGDHMAFNSWVVGLQEFFA